MIPKTKISQAFIETEHSFYNPNGYKRGWFYGYGNKLAAIKHRAQIEQSDDEVF